MSEEPKVGLYFYDEENATLMVYDKDLNENEVADIHADSPFGFKLAEILNRRAPDRVEEALVLAIRQCESDGGCRASAALKEIQKGGKVNG